jgi:hypothetical protein
MATVLRYETPDGEVLVEVDDGPGASPYRPKGIGGSADRALVKASEGFEAALGSVKAAANAFARTMSQVEVVPESAAVEIALKFTAEAGVVFAKTAGEAQMKVALTWKPMREPTAGGGNRG